MFDFEAKKGLLVGQVGHVYTNARAGGIIIPVRANIIPVRAIIIMRAYARTCGEVL